MQRYRSAVTCFNRPPQFFNCAQALYAVSLHGDERRAALRRGRAEGHGRADADGTCGAMAALRYLLVTPSRIAEAETRFRDRAGSTRCRDIRAARTLSCQACVAIAEEILGQLSPTSPHCYTGHTP
jgi:hypothetical protein